MRSSSPTYQRLKSTNRVVYALPDANNNDDDDDDDFEDCSLESTLEALGLEVEEAKHSSSTDAANKIVNVKGHAIRLRVATSARASREGRPSFPSMAAMRTARDIKTNLEKCLQAQGRILLNNVETVKGRSVTGGQSRRMYESHAELQRSSQISVVKSRTLDTYNVDPYFIMYNKLCPQHYDRLLENALRSNAGNSSVTSRAATQGASAQTPRINSRALSTAASVQCVNVEVVFAVAEHALRTQHGIVVRKPLATNAVDPAALLDCSDHELRAMCDSSAIAILSSTEMVYNTHPVKLTNVSVRSVAMEIAKAEMSNMAISERVTTPIGMLHKICTVVANGKDTEDGIIDSAWGCIVLICYLSCDPRTRPLLREAGLTDLDLHVCVIFENYGRAEITRRVRLAEQQQRSSENKKRKAVEKDAAQSQRQRQEQETVEACTLSLPSMPATTISPALLDEDAVSATETLATSRSPPTPPTPPTPPPTPTPAKKRRVVNGVTSNASASDSFGLLAWWLEAFETSELAVLKTLLAESKTQAHLAAQATLKKQTHDAPSVAENPVLQRLSSDSARKNVTACAHLVHVAADQIPSVAVVHTPFAGDKKRGTAVGFVRTQSAAQATALHSVTFAPRGGGGVIILHSKAFCGFRPQAADRDTLPGLFERYELMVSDKLNNFGKLNNAKKMIANNRFERFLTNESDIPKLSSACGWTRSVLVFSVKLAPSESTVEAAAGLCKEAVAAVAATAQPTSTSSFADAATLSPDASVTRLLSVTKNVDDRRRLITEPLCGAASRLAIGIRLNESLRRWMGARTRRNDPVKASCGVIAASETPAFVSAIADSEPLPLAIITDFSLRVPKTVATPAASSVPTRTPTTTMNTAVHVCLDGAMRVVDAAKALHCPLERRALLLVAASQSSFLSDVGAATSATSCNCAIANSKKITIADTSMLPLLTCYDALVGGLAGLERFMNGSAYAQTTGPLLDSGVTPSGLLAHFYRSDKRQHGSLSLGQDVADELAIKLAKSFFVPVDKSGYVACPIQTRGVPHGLIPGVHTALDLYTRALESVRLATGRAATDTTDGVFCLPFSPFTQQLAPTIEASIDSTLRHAFRNPQNAACVHGRSYISDATPEEDAIFVEPLWRRPCQTSVTSNPFCTSYPYLDSMFNAVALIAAIIDCRTKSTSVDAKLDAFHRLVGDYVMARRVDIDPADALAVSDVLWVIFSAVWPLELRVGVGVTSPAIANLAARQAASAYAHYASLKDTQNRSNTSTIESLLAREDVEEVRELWSRFCRPDASMCAWQMALRPLLRLLLINDNSHNVDATASVAEWRKAVDNIARGALFVHTSTTAIRACTPQAFDATHALHGVTSADQIRRPHIDPVFVTSGGDLEVAPRGCLVGLQQFQFRQGLATLLAATHVAGIEAVQVVRNEGPLLLRLSSAADILRSDGSERTAKAISPLQCEGDSPAFGSRQAKLLSCAMQREAWDTNIRSMVPIFASFRPPQADNIRGRGLSETLQKTHKEIAKSLDANNGIITHPVLEEAKLWMERAAVGAAQAPEKVL